MSPLLLLFLTLGGLWLAKLWVDDCRTHLAGREAPGALPGAKPAPRRIVIVAAAGGLMLVALEWGGEVVLGISAAQSRMTVLFAIYSVVAAPVIEEMVFRGWLVVDRRGRFWAAGAAIVASFVFALLHPFLWRWDDGAISWVSGPKAWFSTVAAFASSLWFYAVRLGRWNPSGSLLPCMIAHAAKNAGVVAAKAATGFMTWM